MTEERHVESWRGPTGVVHYCERTRAHPGKPCRCPCGVLRPDEPDEPESPAP